MRSIIFVIALNLVDVLGLWDKGVVHFTINTKDYDPNSQETILKTLAALEKELCVKFFLIPQNYSVAQGQVLFISNPDKQKGCSPTLYDYTKEVIEFVIGYKCMNEKEITRLVVDMLRSSIKQSPSINSFDLMDTFKQKENAESLRHTLVLASDRNYINGHYAAECARLEARASFTDNLAAALRAGNKGEEPTDGPKYLSDENVRFYANKTWPLGFVMYSVQEKLRHTDAYNKLLAAMTEVQRATCLLFDQYVDDGVLAPKNLLYFGEEGADEPDWGFREGNQSINLLSMTATAGHAAHTVNNLLRAVGVHMASNRRDRDVFVQINWKYVKQGKEYLLERVPDEAFVSHLPYDFDSATHAPAAFECADACLSGKQTVHPWQDPLWQRTFRMGQVTSLSAHDVQFVKILYGKECEKRYIHEKQN